MLTIGAFPLPNRVKMVPHAMLFNPLYQGAASLSNRLHHISFTPSSLPCTCCNRRCALFFSSWLYQWTPPPTKTAPIAMRRPRPMAGRRTWTCHDVGEDEAGPVPTTRHVAAPRMTTSDTIGRITATSRHCHGATTDNDDEDLRQAKLVVVCCVFLFAVWCSGHC